MSGVTQTTTRVSLSVSPPTTSAVNDPSVFTITEKAPTRAFFWLKAATTAFTFKTLFRHYAKQVLTPWEVDMKLDGRRKSHKGWAGWLA